MVEIHELKEADPKAVTADIILFTPTFAFSKSEIEKLFPATPVVPISKYEYGTLDIESLWNKITNACISYEQQASKQTKTRKS